MRALGRLGEPFTLCCSSVAPDRLPTAYMRYTKSFCVLCPQGRMWDMSTLNHVRVHDDVAW